MKIIEIEFKNINSLKGTHKIDFSVAPFTTHSLFAITGPTGSGKSTLLDVISLALFNQVPRLGKITRGEVLSKGAILTRNQKDAFAKVTYQSKDGLYASVWRISTNRNNNLREHEMEIQDLSTQKVLDLKKSDVPAKNEELIGLNYDQFIKSVVLAQGEFAQLLKARKDERGELLEKITATGIYRQLGIMAFHKKKEVSSEIEKELQEIELLQRNLLEVADREPLEQELAKLTEHSKPIEKAVVDLEERIRLKVELKEQATRIAQYFQKKELAEKDLEQFEKEHGLSLQKHEKIHLLGDELRTWRQIRSLRADLEKELTDLKKEKEDNEWSINDCMESIRDFIQGDPQVEKIDKELQDFSGRVRKLQNQRDEKVHFYRSLHKEFNTEVREVPFQLNGEVDTAEEKLQELRSSIMADLEELRQEISGLDLNDPVAEKQRLREQLEKARKAEQKGGKLQILSDEIVRIKTEKETILPHLAKLPEKIELEESKAHTAKEKWQKLQLKKENENLRKTLEQHRSHLEEGQACPLCGSLSHPYAVDLPKQQDGLQEEILLAEKELTDRNKEIAALHAHLKQYRQRLEELQKAEQLRESELESQKKDFEEAYGPDLSEGITWSSLVSRHESQLATLEKYEQEKRRTAAINSGLRLLKELQEVLVQGKEIKEQLNLLYPGKDIDADCLELQTRWSRLQHQKITFEKLSNDLQNKLSGKLSELQRLEEDLIPRLVREGCKDISEALERLLPQQQATALRKKKEALCQETAKIEAGMKTLSEQLEKLREKDLPVTEEALRVDLEENKQQLSGWNQRCEELRRKLLNDQDIRNQVKTIEAGVSEKKKKIRRWELLNQLIGDATGKRFNDFAQDLSLSQLLLLANKRLEVLSDRYHIDKPVDGEDDGLVAIDDHMGGQRRSVKTLSGGETFILSLSMALALSDLASRNVEINSLFIDEGFGSLDPETLDQTLDTLERLQAESSKTIGLISHVDSLKERIATQIRLTRNGQGYSSLEVIG